ncbi:MAG TPA: hypothetical protein VFA38_04385, partial [Nitrospirales bacterium]|nr:hypothetical protein [Nitrospirales bacterium]
KAARRARRAIDRWGSGWNVTPAEVSRNLRGLTDDALCYLLARSAPMAARRIRRYLTRYREVEPLLTGADLQTLGIAAGPVFRRILERLRDARLNGVVKTKADERVLAVRIAKRYSARTGAATGAPSLSSTRDISSRDSDSSA